MFRPQIQKTRVLFLLALLNMVMVYWAVNSYEQLGVDDAYGYGLSGSGLTVGIADSGLCYDANNEANTSKEKARLEIESQTSAARDQLSKQADDLSELIVNRLILEK